ncbi:YceD family protein [Anaerosalibacter sp. Marseille-P3206]|uniref:YceD family protein n=1 Tax=Anaerosalibacter sp. Marseille-P3206 TaxID=1871005 RepID=UPI000986BFCD|nr:DUF177 domain-containing protein [Anaerosalibacter sp. Marseille-P3206]
MIIDLTGFLDRTTANLHFDNTLEKESIEVGGREIIFEKPILVTVDVYRVDGSDYLSGYVNYEYTESCARCLKQFTQEVKGVLSGRLIEKTNDYDEDEIDEDVINYEGEILDLTEHIMNAIVLSLPMKSLCSEDCKGLCPKCGKDLNKGKCDCTIEEIDPRLAKLKDLFK